MSVLIESLKNTTGSSTTSFQSLEEGCMNLMEATLDFESGFNRVYLEQISVELNESYLTEAEKEKEKGNFWEKIKTFFKNMIEKVKEFFRNVYNKFAMSFGSFIKIIDSCIAKVNNSKAEFSKEKNTKLNDKDAKSMKKSGDTEAGGVYKYKSSVLNIVKDIRQDISDAFTTNYKKTSSMNVKAAKNMAKDDSVDSLLTEHMDKTSYKKMKDADFKDKNAVLADLKEVRTTVATLTADIKGLKVTLDQIIKTSQTSASIADQLKAKKDDEAQDKVDTVKNNKEVVTQANRYSSKLMAVLIKISRTNTGYAKRIAGAYGRA